MVALQIRDVPEDIRDVLAERASARGQSMQAFLLALVQAEAQRARNATVLARFTQRTDGTRSTPGQTADELVELRGQSSK